jgi:RecG-like helicase
MPQGTRTQAPLPLSERQVTTLKGVGDKLADLLGRLGIRSVQDCCSTFPSDTKTGPK